MNKHKDIKAEYGQVVVGGRARQAVVSFVHAFQQNLAFTFGRTLSP